MDLGARVSVRGRYSGGGVLASDFVFLLRRRGGVCSDAAAEFGRLYRSGCRRTGPARGQKTASSVLGVGCEDGGSGFISRRRRRGELDLEFDGRLGARPRPISYSGLGFASGEPFSRSTKLLQRWSRVELGSDGFRLFSLRWSPRWHRRWTAGEGAGAESPEGFSVIFLFWGFLCAFVRDHVLFLVPSGCVRVLYVPS